ncbi:ASCH domain-containing protein [Methylocystis sp.]|uniref:ASCH domain-containing protein n=1 Tax=Methylocystis sp. TaxID=1911079 RepID=UPI003D133A6B
MGIPIKAISVVRPGGSLIAAGKKTLEVRRWHPLLQLGENLLVVENNRFLKGEDEDQGAAVAIVRVTAVRPFCKFDMALACASSFEEGWLAWVLSDVRSLAFPIPVAARRKIYEVELPDDFPTAQIGAHLSV